MFYGNILTEAAYKASELFKNTSVKVEDGDPSEKDRALELLAKHWNKILDKFAKEGWDYIKESRKQVKDWHSEYKTKEDFKKAIKPKGITLYLDRYNGKTDFYTASIYAEPDKSLDEHTPSLEVNFSDKACKIPYNVQYDG